MLGAARVHASPSPAAATVAAKVLLVKPHSQPQPQQTLSPATSSPPAVAATQSTSAAPKTVLRVQLLPLTAAASALVTAAGLNPLLQLNVSGALSVASIMRSVLKQRWAGVAGVSGLRLQLPAGVAAVGLQCPAGGWGVEEGRAVTIDGLHRSLGMPNPFQLTYTLPGAEKPAAPAATATSAASRPAHPAGSASASATASVSATAAAPCAAAPASASSLLPSAPVAATPAVSSSGVPSASASVGGSLSPEEMMRLLKQLSPAQAQHIFNSMYGPANPALANMPAMPSLLSTTPVPLPAGSHQSAPFAAPGTATIAAAASSSLAAVPVLVTPTPAPRVRSCLPPSSFRAFEPARPAGAHHLQSTSLRLPSAPVAFAPASAPAHAARGKKQKLAHAAPASVGPAAAASAASSESVAKREGAEEEAEEEAEEVELRHKEAARDARIDAFFDDALPVPMLPTLDAAAFGGAYAAAARSDSGAADAVTSSSQLKAEMDDLFGPSEDADEHAGDAAAAAPMLPAVAGTRTIAMTPTPSLATQSPFGAGGVRSSSVKKSLFQSFMDSSDAGAAAAVSAAAAPSPASAGPRWPFAAAAAANGGASQRNIFPSHSEVAAAAAAASSAPSCAAAAAAAAVAIPGYRQPLGTLYAASAASALNISNNLSCTAPLPSYRVTVSADSPTAAAAAAALSQSVPLSFPSALPASNKENQLQQLAPPAPSALMALLMNSPSKLALMGSSSSWQGGSAAAAASGMGAPRLRPSSSQQLFQASSAAAAGPNAHMGTPRGAKGSKASAGGSGGSAGTAGKKKGRDAAGSGGSAGSKRTASGSGKGSKSDKKAKLSGSASSKERGSKPDRKRKASAESKSGPVAKKGKKERAGKKARRAPSGTGNAAGAGGACGAFSPAATEGDEGEEEEEDVNWDEWAEELERELSSDGTESDPSEASALSSPTSSAGGDASSPDLSPCSPASSSGGPALLGTAPADMELDMCSPLPPVAEVSASAENSRVDSFDEEQQRQQQMMHQLPPSFFHAHAEEEEHARHAHEDQAHTHAAGTGAGADPFASPDWMTQGIVMPPAGHAHEHEPHGEHLHGSEDDGFLGLLGGGSLQQLPQHPRQPSASPPAPFIDAAAIERAAAAHSTPARSLPPPADLSTAEFALDPRLDRLLQQCGGNVALFLQAPSQPAAGRGQSA